jgi:hypothetical protein
LSRLTATNCGAIWIERRLKKFKIWRDALLLNDLRTLAERLL